MSGATDATRYVTASDLPVKAVYTHEDLAGFDVERDLGSPGEAPFTRGNHAGMYRTMPWRIRQLTAHGSVEDKRDRMRYALSLGETAVTVTGDVTSSNMFDLDHPEIVARKSDVGLWGAPILSVRDWEIMFEDLPLDKLYVGCMGSAYDQSFNFGCYFGLAEKNGIPISKLTGTGFMDMGTTYLAGTYPEPMAPRKVMRLVGDVIEFCVQSTPHVTPSSFSGYNIRESGITAYQEIAVIMAGAIAYIEELLRRGMGIDEFAPGLAATHLSCDRDFFEEIAKFRAIRRTWCRLLKERYHAQNPKSLKLRIHVQTAGAALTRQQPLNNIIRTAYHVLAAALGGVQSMHSDGYDEALCVPSEEAALLAIRTQQIAQLETNVISVADPLGGSYYVESLTNAVEEQAWDYLKKIEENGGLIGALENGWLYREFTKAMLEEERKLQSGEKKFVGVNCFEMEKEPFQIPTFRPDPKVWEKEMARLDKLRKERDNSKVTSALDEVRRTLETGQNVVRPAIEAAKAYATTGEVGKVYREMLSVWQPPIQY